MVILSTSAPLAKCRVLYIGTAVPLETAIGIEAIQKPLSERFPVEDDSRIEGIDAYVSINDTNIQLQFVNDSDQIIQFPISALSMCAAVRCISTVNAATGEKNHRFVSLNDPAAGGENSRRPAIFTTITRRTQGRKVLECHGYICQSAEDALKLVKYASIAGKNFKQNAAGNKTPQPSGTTRTNGLATPSVARVNVESIPAAFNRMSVNSNTMTSGTKMRLIPGEQISQLPAGPEFYEPVSTQGYFYSSNKADVKKYSIEKLGGRNEDRTDVASEIPHVSPRLVNGDVPPAPPSEPALPTGGHIPTQPLFIPYRGPRVPMPHPHFGGPPMFYGPPPPPHMYPVPMRPRFFSPPPPMMRPQPFMIPPGAPPPMMAAPIYLRRPRRASHSGSRSRSRSSSTIKSRDSRSRSPKPNGYDNENTTLKVPNGVAESSSDESSAIITRSKTPPKDYRHAKPTRQSRREVYEVKYGIAPSLPERDGYDVPRRPYDYHAYPPANGGFMPFPMYNPHTRSRSVPAYDRRRSKSPNKKDRKKKHKKGKKNKQAKHNLPRYPMQNGVREHLYAQNGVREPIYMQNGVKEPTYLRSTKAPRSDVSTDSLGGYHSEIPRQTNADTSGYEFYPPRDFRKSGKQFMNERGFGQSLKNDPLGRSTRPVPSAYDLSDANSPPPLRGSRRDEDVDFNLY